MVLVASYGEMVFQKTAHRRMVCQTAREMAGGTVVVPSDSQSVHQSWGDPAPLQNLLAPQSRPSQTLGDSVVQTSSTPYLSSCLAACITWPDSHLFLAPASFIRRPVLRYI